MNSLLKKFTFSEELTDVIENCKGVSVPTSKAELYDMVFGPEHADVYDVVFDVPGKGLFKEADVVRCKNGASVNFTEDYMRRREPDCMRIADDKPTDKKRFADVYGYKFDKLRQETMEWFKTQELILMPFNSGGNEYGYGSMLVCPKQCAFFAFALAHLQGFVNAEETQSLCIEDHYTNGRPPLELGGVLYCDRETVDKIEKMKVCTCLNPLHTAMSIYGCMLGYTLISAEMADEDLRSFIQKIGYIEAMPVVVDPGVLNPYEFIGAVINRRLPNPFMPDAPQRIATDTSQKLAIRFGETIKAYEARGLDKSNLVLIPLVLAGYARYLKGIDDNGQPFEISTDPLLAELQAIVAPLKVEAGEQDFSCLKALYSRTDVFGVDLYAVGLGEKIESMAKELFAGPGAVRATLHKYVKAR